MEKIVNEIDLKFLLEKDKIIAGIHLKYGAPPNWQREEGFQTLAKIILEQQVSLESARSHFEKLKSFIGEFIVENILKLTDEEMRNCFISRQKAKYLRELSNAILNKELILENLNQLNETEIREKLISIKGIGHWTADIYLLFCLQSKDIFPVGDIAVVNTIKELYEVSTQEEILKIAEKWNPNRSLGTYFMWHYYLNKRGRNAVY